MSLNDKTVCIPVIGAVAVFAFLLYKNLTGRCGNQGRVNRKQQMDSSKIVHTFDIEDYGTKAVYCRCWKSDKFPYCDGSHNKHNELTGDNVGPLIVNFKEKSS